MRKALVTGGAGFVGSYLVDRLVARGEFDQIVVYDNLQRGRLENIAAHVSGGAVRFAARDVRDVDALRAAMAGAAVVFHLAGQSRVVTASQDIAYSITTNVSGTVNVLTVAKECGVRRVVFTSSREVYGEPATLPVSEDAPLRAKNVYGVSKVAAEMSCRAFSQNGIETAVLRVSNVYGPRDRGRVVPTFVENALRGKPLVVYGGRQVIDFVWVEDVVDVLIHVATCTDPPRSPVNVGSGIGTGITTLAERVLNLTRSSSTIAVVPPRSIEVSRFVADTKRLKALMGTGALRPPLEKLPEVVDEVRALCARGTT
jgi:UDP-glucose 4-epimerase